MQIIPELRIFSAPGSPEMFPVPCEPVFAWAVVDRIVDLLVSKKARFTHVRGKFCGIVSGKRFSAHGGSMIPDM